MSRQRGCGAPAGPPASARGPRRRPVIPQGSRPRAAGRPEGARVAHADQAMRQAGSSARELGPAVSRPCPPHPLKNMLQKGGRNGERRLPAGPRLHPAPHTPLQPLAPATLPRSRPAGLGCSGPQLCATLSPARRTSHVGRDDLYPDAESTCRRARPGANASALCELRSWSCETRPAGVSPPAPPCPATSTHGPVPAASQAPALTSRTAADMPSETELFTSAEQCLRAACRSPCAISGSSRTPAALQRQGAGGCAHRGALADGRDRPQTLCTRPSPVRLGGSPWPSATPSHKRP